MASALMARQTWPPQGRLSQPLLQPWMHLIPLAVLYGEGTSFSASRIYFLVAPRRGESCEIHCRQPQGGGRQLRMLQLVEAGPGAHLLSAVAKGQCVQGQKPASIWGCGPCGHQPQETPRDVLWALPGLPLRLWCVEGTGTRRTVGRGGTRCWRCRRRELGMEEDSPKASFPIILPKGAPIPMGQPRGCSSGRETRLGGLELLLGKGTSCHQAKPGKVTLRVWQTQSTTSVPSATTAAELWARCTAWLWRGGGVERAAGGERKAAR